MKARAVGTLKNPSAAFDQRRTVFTLHIITARARPSIATQCRRLDG